MRAIALLSMWKTRNALRTLISDPRKLVPLLIFIALMIFSLGMSSLGMRQNPNHTNLGEVHVDPALFGGSLFLAMILIAIGTIDTGLGDGLLAFGMSDVDYVFPSPISRRTVLAYRLPMLTLGALFSTLFFLYLYGLGLRLVDVRVSADGNLQTPWWYGPAGVALCVGIYLNLAMFLAIQIENRKLLHRIVMSCFVGGLGVIGVVSYLGGLHAFLAIVGSPVLKWAFFPCVWASDALAQQVRHVADLSPIRFLSACYLGSLVPMFASNSNFYERSIASSERVAASRRAAKAGFAALQANKAASIRFKSTRMYTIPPFGQGAQALAWAHLCAAAKKPYANFLFPALGGVGCGVAAHFAGVTVHESGIGAIVLVSFYLSFGFMASAKAASESAVRRGDLIAPLPITAWKAVVANLTVPWLAMFGFCLGAGITYAGTGSDEWPLIAFGLCLTFPLRLGARMVLQYILVLSYPDFADKVQQLIAAGVYYMFAAPFFFVELILAIPAILLHSVWVGLITLSVLQVPFLVLLLWLAGLASDRAVASGEPVNLFKLAAAKPK